MAGLTVGVGRSVAVVLGMSAFAMCSLVCAGQNTGSEMAPVIDVHVHAMDESWPGGGAMCPNEAKFLASDPKAKEAPFGWDV